MAGRLKLMGQAKYQNDGDPRTSGPGFALTEHRDMLTQPLRWRRPRRIFVNSMSDLFHEDVSDEFIAEVFGVMAECRWTFKPECHQFQILTKRPQRMARLLTDEKWWEIVDGLESASLGGSIIQPEVRRPLRNVWLGTSIESDRYAFRANHLRGTPAAVRFLSLEPLLGPLPSLNLTDIDWVIVGGESGPGSRPMRVEWARDLRDRCIEAGVPFLFKQWGSHDADGVPMNKHKAGRELDGRTWDQYPDAMHAPR